MLRAAAFLILIAVGAAPSHPSFLTGFWFGQGEPHDKSEMWLAHAYPNGDFAVQFRACRKGQKGKRVPDLIPPPKQSSLI